MCVLISWFSSAPDYFAYEVKCRFQTAEAEVATHTMALQMANTTISLTDGVPFAGVNPDLRFRHFQQSPCLGARRHEAAVWKLGVALFDDVDPDLPPGTPSAKYNYALHLRRLRALSEWLAEVVAGAVEEDCRSPRSTSSSSSSRAASNVFALLSGHQIERACQAALSNSDLRLATLVAQAGSDDTFRENVYLQLVKWREQRVDAYVDKAYRRVYELLSGNVGKSEGTGSFGDPVDASETIYVAEGLDWKRAFGLHLWYGLFEAPVAETVRHYEEATVDDDARTAAPLPWYVEEAHDSGSTKDEEVRWKIEGERVNDALFEIIKLFVDPTHDLAAALVPRGFSPSPFDVRLPWHIYVILSRALERRDFEDREELSVVGGGGEFVEGAAAAISQTADALTVDCAHQLESIGLWTWAALVLLHLPIPEWYVYKKSSG
jgi:nuclear pore complex protein Nup98-Nup96